jgi:hypothetical protein
MHESKRKNNDIMHQVAKHGRWLSPIADQSHTSHVPHAQVSSPDFDPHRTHPLQDFDSTDALGHCLAHPNAINKQLAPHCPLRLGYFIFQKAKLYAISFNISATTLFMCTARDQGMTENNRHKDTRTKGLRLNSYHISGRKFGLTWSLLLLGERRSFARDHVVCLNHLKDKNQEAMHACPSLTQSTRCIQIYK